MTYPKQGTLLNKPVLVVFNYDTSNQFAGTCIRNDIEDPYLTIFKLNDGRIVLSGECQYRPKD